MNLALAVFRQVVTIAQVLNWQIAIACQKNRQALYCSTSYPGFG